MMLRSTTISTNNESTYKHPYFNNIIRIKESSWCAAIFPVFDNSALHLKAKQGLNQFKAKDSSCDQSMDASKNEG